MKCKISKCLLILIKYPKFYNKNRISLLFNKMNKIMQINIFYFIAYQRNTIFIIKISVLN